MSYTDTSHRFGGGGGGGGGLSSSVSHNVRTYEATKAQQTTDRQPDKIHWDYNAAFRDEPYRQLHHQNGVIGIVSIRLLEASDLKRSYWSPLAIGPVKHLGLSKAHGDVSSFCTFSLGFHDHPRPTYDVSQSSPGSASSSATNSANNSDDEYDNRKPAAVPTSGSGNNNNPGSSKIIMNGIEWKSSPVVEHNNNPVWENCIIEIPLRKGAARSDGMCIHLNIRVDEEATAVESFIPGILAHANNPNDRLLGIGQFDLTTLILGETVDGVPVPGVRDEWIPISLTPDDHLVQQQQDRILIDLQQQLQYDKNDPLAPPATADEPVKKGSHNSTESITGMVRVLVSYIPNGLDPEKNDIVALESFARRDPTISSCIPILPPLQPLTVLDRRGPYVLCEYSLPIGFIAQRRNSSNNDASKPVKAQVRLHRNAIFVIERQNLLDAAHNLVRLPIDVALSTPLGNAVCTALGPAISAGSELLMPTILSLKLIWMATRATAVASVSGVNALTSTLWREGANSLLNNHNQPNYNNNNNNNSDRGNNNSNQQRRNTVGTAQFVQL